jgi:hypothetical protein
MACRSPALVTRAERKRLATDARTRSNLRSVAIARSVVRAKRDDARELAMANFRAFMALTEHEPTADELQQAREVLADPPHARQRRLFQGAT